MYYGAIKKNDIANGEGVRTSLFVSGCRNRCENCFNRETWAFDYGTPFTAQTAEEVYRTFADNAYLSGLSILGGEPMEPENQEALLPFLQEFRRRFPDKSVWLYTGNLYEELSGTPGTHPKCLPITAALLSCVDILVDGRFVQALHRLGLRFRGSSNQRILDMNRTRLCGHPVIWEGCQGDREYPSKEKEKK